VGPVAALKMTLSVAASKTNYSCQMRLMPMMTADMTPCHMATCIFTSRPTMWNSTINTLSMMIAELLANVRENLWFRTWGPAY
jgi:hypothetical protein